MHCPLCGFEFERHAAPCEHSCPLGKLCKLICCPNCRYEFPEQPQSLSWLGRLFRPRPPAPTHRELLCLNELEEGEQSELVCLNCAHASRRSALAVYGLVPGSRLVLQQKSPSFVIRVGETELALEAAIAGEIFVKRVKP